MLKYVGVLLTQQQAATIASKLCNKDLSDMSDELNFANTVFLLVANLDKYFPHYDFHATPVPRDSKKEEDIHFLIVCQAYNNPHETMEKYEKLPATKRDRRLFGWLKRHGMDVAQMVSQWTTVPDPLAGREL